MELNTLLYLAFSLFLCLAAGKLMKLLRLPNVTGYLIMGLLCGPYCLKLLPASLIETLGIIPEVALGFIAFSIGAEFKLSYLKQVGKAPVVIAIFEALGAVFLVDLILILCGNDVRFSIVLGAIAAATAPAATLMVVRQYKANGPVTQTLLPVVAIDDAVALMAFGISVAIAKALDPAASVSVLTTLLSPVVEILGALLFGALLGLGFVILTKYFTGRGNRLAITYAMIFLCVGIADMLGLSSLLACMMMSAVYCNLSPVCKTVFEQTDRITPPIFMLFFFLSGAELDLSVLPTVGAIGALYIVFRVLGKLLGCYLGSRLVHSAAAVQKYLGFTLIPQAGVAIGLSSLAMTVVPAYGVKIRTIILCGTVLYELTGPVITKLVLKKAGEIKATVPASTQKRVDKRQ